MLRSSVQRMGRYLLTCRKLVFGREYLSSTTKWIFVPTFDPATGDAALFVRHNADEAPSAVKLLDFFDALPFSDRLNFLVDVQYLVAFVCTE